MHCDHWTYYLCILFIRACKTARTSAVLCGENVGRKETDNNGINRCIITVVWDSGGPKMDKTSGRMASSVENVRVNWSNRDLRGSTLVGDKHESNTECIHSVFACWSADKLSDCFFLLLGVVVVDRNNLLRRSVIVSFSRGGLFVEPEIDWYDCCWGSCCCNCDWSELCASGSVPAAPSFPELSFFQSPTLSIQMKNFDSQIKNIIIECGIFHWRTEISAKSVRRLTKHHFEKETKKSNEGTESKF